MTLAAMSCNRYVLICHRHLYHRIFNTRNSVIMCCCFYLIGFVLIAFNFIGIGDHSFDHKSLECIWDRMANHNYTIVFAVVMVLIPITVIGLSYVRLYMHVRQAKMKIHSHGNSTNPRSEAAASVIQPATSFDELELARNGIDATAGSAQKVPNRENDEQEEIEPEESDLARREEFLKNLRFGASGPLTEKRLHPLHGMSKKTQKSSYDFDMNERPSQSVVGTQKNKHSRAGGGSTTSKLKLARALFIIYLVFSACWLPFSLLIVLDADDTFSHELHVTIVAWAHLHPSINWLVYYLTHQKFYIAFRKLLGFDRCCA